MAVSFKGIALFTPGGDCVYCLDTQKRAHWHLDLCAALQRQLGLQEPPYFLLPGFTATVDRWVDATTQATITVAEAYPRVRRFQPLLNALFDLDALRWQPNYTDYDPCAVALIESYQATFPQLWDHHDLVMRVESPQTTIGADANALPFSPGTWSPPEPYLFKLFVSGSDTAATEKMLRLLHTTLESTLLGPYTLKVIDVLKQPDQAEADHISATPTLIQVSPAPYRRIVGNWLNPQQMVQLLGGG
ncbi:MAG: circadian clock KaiB family protein [Nodosilinea sp.]